jgi:iron complex transport system permease protein
MILTGIALMYVFSAVTALLMFFADPDAVKSVYIWTVGSLGKADWNSIPFVAAVAAVCFIFLQINAGALNVMTAGDKSAGSLGVNVQRMRILVLLVSSLMTAAIVSFTGTIGFIGLVSPHLCRLIIGSDNRFLIPASALIGSILLLTADFTARTIISPVILPVGTITAFIGSPLFFYLLIKRKKEHV